MATRARLLDAAVTAFSEHGFHGTSTRDIAEAAQMSPAAVYAHYATKELLLHQIALAGHRDVATATAEAVHDLVCPTQRLVALMTAFTAWHAHSRVRARVIQYELAALIPEHRDEIAVMRRAMTMTFRDLIASGTELGEFSPVPIELTANTLLSLGIDVARWFRPEQSWSVEELAAHHADVALILVGAREHADCPNLPERRA